MNLADSAKHYNAFYFAHHCGKPYRRDKEWLDFFASIAERIVSDVRPRTVLDAGCAMGFLVETLRDRGVDAAGIDVSEYAIQKVRTDIRSYCVTGSVTDPLPQRYDLIVCIEVLEHLTSREAEQAVRNFSQHTDDVLFSSTPYDYKEVTHVNVRPPDYWAELFARYGFYRDVDFDASFICPWAVRFRISHDPPPRIVACYERRVWQLEKEVQALRELNFEQRNELASKDQGLEGFKDGPAGMSAQSNEPRLLSSEGGESGFDVESLTALLHESERTASSLAAQLTEKENQLQQMTSTLGWRILSRYGPVKYRYVLPSYRLIKRLLKGEIREKANPALSYQVWARRCEEIRYNRGQAVRAIAQFRYNPSISIIMPVYNAPRDCLGKALDSVLNQYYANWELCICDDASTAPHVREMIEGYASRESRIKVVFAEENGGIAVASNRALALATGEFVGFLDHDDELTPDALYEVIVTLQDVEADLIYSDEDKIDKRGRRCDPFFKPGWSPDLLLACNYICHFSVYRKRLVDEIGGFRESFDGSQDYDLVLRFSERTSKIVHIPKIMYHWRQVPSSAAASTKAKPYAYEAAKKALTQALQRRGIEGVVEAQVSPGFYTIRRQMVQPGKVTVIVPTRDRLNLLHQCISSIESKTDYKNYEIIIVDNGSRNAETLEYLRQMPHRVLRDDSAFNFSRLNNLAAREARGEYLLFLNNDTEVIKGEWLSAMVEQAQRPEVGAVGAKLLYPNGKIQHSGVILGLGGVANHSHRFDDGRDGFGYFNFPNVVRNYSAVTAACMMTRRDVFNEVGGFNESDLAVTFNDVDYCLRLRKKGYLVVFTPSALLYHYESASRGFLVNPREVAYMWAKWRQELTSDPYYNPNLSLTREDFSVDFSKPEAFYCVCSQELSDAKVGPLTERNTIGQEFRLTGYDKFCAIGVKFGIHSRRRAGKIRLRLWESLQSGQELALVEVDCGSIRENEYHIFPFEPIRNADLSRLYFCIEHFGCAPNADLTVWKHSVTVSTNGPCFENHHPSIGSLTFKAYCLKQFR
jgi:GT2 family glycosyltransferase